MPISEKIRASMERSSWIRKMFEEGIERKAKFGPENVFDFSLGNPDLEPPSKALDVLVEVAKDTTPGQHAYMPNAGFSETRQAVADYLNTFNGSRFSSGDVIMTVGAGGGLNVIFKAILNPQDEVIIPSPYFVEYNSYLDNHQGVPKVVACHADFSLNLEAISEAVSEKTRAVLINSPHNPTGRVYRKEELAELSKLLDHHSAKLGKPIYLVSDEPYRKIIYDGIVVPSVFDAYRESIVVTSFSKDLSLPGERIGYIAVNPEISDKTLLVGGMVFCNRILGFVNAPALMQRAIRHLLEESVDISIYQRRRDIFCEGLEAAGYEFQKPEGAFYLFPRSPVADDAEFVRALQEENILTVPGTGFGGPGHFRIAYCVEDKVIEKALPGFKRVMDKYR
ncbi:MAG: pyridoxal phosphate-dependent aminotransferase [Desulfatiglandaceae bacterium]|jgi:aspartate aminotransferase